MKQPRRSLPPSLAHCGGHHAFFSLAPTSYSGVATFVRIGVTTAAAAIALSDDAFFGPRRSEVDSLPAGRLAELDGEGRVVATDHIAFVLVNVYAPCVNCEDPARMADRRAFKNDFNVSPLTRIGIHVPYTRAPLLRNHALRQLQSVYDGADC